jgi:hypothetical protein
MTAARSCTKAAYSPSVSQRAPAREDSACGQAGNVAVDAGGRHVVEFGHHLAGGQFPAVEERLNDAQPYRMQQELSARHDPGNSSHSLILLTATTAVLVLRFEMLCLQQLAQTPDEQLRVFTRPGWILLIVLFIPVGGLLYLAAGRWQ